VEVHERFRLVVLRVAPTGDEWRPGRDMIDEVKRGTRVFQSWYGLGTVLSAVPVNCCRTVAGSGAEAGI
jgi:hypothetical protein